MTAKECLYKATKACSHERMDYLLPCRDCCRGAILAHAEAVREEAASIAESYCDHGIDIAKQIRALKLE